MANPNWEGISELIPIVIVGIFFIYSFFKKKKAKTTASSQEQILTPANTSKDFPSAGKEPEEDKLKPVPEGNRLTQENETIKLVYVPELELYVIKGYTPHLLPQDQENFEPQLKIEPKTELTPETQPKAIISSEKTLGKYWPAQKLFQDQYDFRWATIFKEILDKPKGLKF